MLKIENLTKIFNKEEGIENQKIALNNVSIHINKGDFVTIIGGNGSGKSTLMNMISGVYDADGGNIYIDDVNVTDMPEHKRAKYLGRVFQDPLMGTAPNMSILENLELASRRCKKPTLKWGFSKDNQVEFLKLIEGLNLGLETRLSQKVGLLSGGQRQALTLLMATFEKPKVLLLDEHTAALDPKTASKVLDLTEKIVKENNLTTLMITHNMKDAIKYGNRLIMLSEGNLILDISGEEKANITIEELLQKFENSGTTVSDKMLF